MQSTKIRGVLNGLSLQISLQLSPRLLQTALGSHRSFGRSYDSLGFLFVQLANGGDRKTEAECENQNREENDGVEGVVEERYRRDGLQHRRRRHQLVPRSHGSRYTCHSSPS